MTKSYCVTVKLLRRQRKFTLPRFWVLKRWVNGKGTKLMLSLGWETVIIFGTFEKKNKEKKNDKISQFKMYRKTNKLTFWSEMVFVSAIFIVFLSGLYLLHPGFILFPFYFHLSLFLVDVCLVCFFWGGADCFFWFTLFCVELVTSVWLKVDVNGRGLDGISSCPHIPE